MKINLAVLFVSLPKSPEQCSHGCFLIYAMETGLIKSDRSITTTISVKITLIWLMNAKICSDNNYVITKTGLTFFKSLRLNCPIYQNPRESSSRSRIFLILLVCIYVFIYLCIYLCDASRQTKNDTDLKLVRMLP